MKMSEYEVLKTRIEKADRIMSDKYELEIWIKYFKRVINGEKCVYIKEKDSRRKPTPEEIEKARIDLKSYTQKIHAFDSQFAEL